MHYTPPIAETLILAVVIGCILGLFIRLIINASRPRKPISISRRTRIPQRRTRIPSRTIYPQRSLRTVSWGTRYPCAQGRAAFREARRRGKDFYSACDEMWTRERLSRERRRLL